MGEAGMLGPEAATAVGHVIMNRVASPDFPDTFEEVIAQGFFGWQEPTQEYIDLAWGMFGQPDQTGGCLFVLSAQDRRMLDFGPGVLWFGRGKYQLHFYKSWGENGEET